MSGICLVSSLSFFNVFGWEPKYLLHFLMSLHDMNMMGWWVGIKWVGKETSSFSLYIFIFILDINFLFAIEMSFACVLYKKQKNIVGAHTHIRVFLLYHVLYFQYCGCLMLVGWRNRFGFFWFWLYCRWVLKMNWWGFVFVLNITIWAVKSDILFVNIT